MPDAAAPVVARPSAAATPLALWRRAHGTDRLFIAWFVGLGAVVAWHRADDWPVLVGLHVAALALIFRAGYLSYFVLLLIVAGRFRRRREEAPFRGVIAASVLANLLCYVIFLTWPMEGPAHTLPPLAGEPLAGGPLRDLVLFVQQAGVHGNAFPSAHVAGALPPLVFAWRYARRLGIVLAGLIVLMGLGAVHDGYHYASDVIAGAAVGAAAAAIVLAAQHAPAWARRLNLPAA